MVFCLDTNAFIEPWHRRYPIDVFPGYWEGIDAFAAQGRIVCTDQVFDELTRVEDGLLTWAKDRKDNFFRAPDDGVQVILREIMHNHPKLVDAKKNRSGADPWVIAQAEAANAVVVSEEGSGGSRVRIPDVCRARKVQCISILQMIREMNLKF